MSKKCGIGKFIAGAAIGGALGVLFAPKKGSESRKELKEKAVDAANKVKNADYNKIIKDVEKKFETLKEEVKDLDKEKALKIVKEKAAVIKKKADDIVAYAIEKGTPVVEQKAQEAKEGLIKLLNATVEKLESTDNKKTPKKAAKK